MKAGIMVGLLSLALTAPVFADCGHCGAEGKHGDKEHAGAMCPMHGEKNAVLIEASDALKESNPELSAKLQDLAEHCCGGHS